MPPTDPAQLAARDVSFSDLDSMSAQCSEQNTSSPSKKLCMVPKARRMPSKKPKDDSLLAFLCAHIVEHQIGISINLILLLSLAHICFPRARRRTRTFFELSYRDPSTGLYTQGWDDMPFVFLWTIIFTGLRVAVMDYVLKPLANFGGIRSKRARVRFAEQAWLLVYYLPVWLFGMYIMYNSSFWLDLRAMWADFPTRTMTGLVKFYYLVQFAFYFHMIIVVNIEERRKDYHQMFIHHIITCGLISMSYSYYQTKVGIVILCLMDVVDIFLSTAKDLKYLGFSVACDVMFGLFIVAWFVARHVLYLAVCYSTYVHVPEVMPYGCYDSVTGEKLAETEESGIMTHILQSFRDPGAPVCFNKRIQSNFLAFLLALQVVTLIWFYMIIKVAYKVVTGQGADDVRSDDEGEDEEEEDFDVDEDLEAHHLNGMVQLPLEEEVGVEGLHFTRQGSPSKGSGVKGYRRNGNKSGSSRSSGISIPGHGDHKELLGRIGCDKPS
ncbi:longevity assurance proteins LAG1/LAC1 [Pseudovirgaria hyperparasitica]|uniref:Longevity assurance proteins LAG1/LAC1 n=1 Tax=Pseudovirgaria hyperparasitica TaxID=470096 RepID=A0A6A6W857_9PEZI|nr:longevity assurance proteins LAG1/LAC1 [Pseudovirgaria hyperparasitica]KAF2758389.1 longevity assurance proteins LAG1/LAC1 [Pseudovirgaria hyperparasitica]